MTLEQPRPASADTRRIVRRVLRPIRFFDGMTILDVGSGDGMVAETARRRAGPHSTVIQAQPDLTHAIPSDSVDAIVGRTSFTHAADKQRAAAEFWRLLKRGGIASIAEPILYDEALLTRALKRRVERSPTQDALLALTHRWKSAQYPDTLEGAGRIPEVNFTERDLVTHFLKAGFTAVRLRFWIDVGYAPPRSWQEFIDFTPHRMAPSLASILTTRFTADERRYFEERMRPAVAAGASLETRRTAYLRAAKPAIDQAPATWLKA